MFDRGALRKDYRGKTVARAARERYGCRSERRGGRLAGSSDKILSAVAFAESYPIPFARTLGISVASLRLPFFVRKLILKEV